jgi:hypothetical protein
MLKGRDDETRRTALTPERSAGLNRSGFLAQVGTLNFRASKGSTVRLPKTP